MQEVMIISEKITRKNNFRRTKLEKLIYIRNVDGTLNYIRLIVDTVKVELFFNKHKKRILINVIEEQKWSMILGILWLAHHNPEINWRTREVQIMRCSDECEKK